MSSGEVERQPHVVIGGREITDIQRDRTRREEQREQKRDQVILRAGITDEILWADSIGRRNNSKRRSCDGRKEEAPR